MKERIILAPGVSGSELLRTLAKFGVNTIGLRIMSSAELSKFVLMKSGTSVTDEFLTSREEPSVIYSFLKEIPYFKAASYADAENLAATLGTVRGLITEDEAETFAKNLGDAEFPDKNKAIVEVYKRYIAECQANSRIDGVALVRKAIEVGSDLSEDYDFFELEEYSLKPLDEKLLSVISGGNHKKIKLRELFNKEAKDVEHLEITSAYGTINEVLSIIDDIYSRGLALDTCQIACASSGAYSQVIYDIATQQNIPVTYGCGVPIGNTNPARLLKLLMTWQTSGFYGIDALRAVLLSEAFDRVTLAKTLKDTEEISNREIEKLVKMAGSLRISTDTAENKKRLDALRATGLDDKQSTILDWTEKLAHEFEKGLASIIDNYSVIRPEPTGRIDRSAVNVITDTLNAYVRYAPEGDIAEVIPELLAKGVSSESSKEGMLHITSITGAMSSMRPNLYVCGLSAANFPGSPSENYLMLDNDFKKFETEDNKALLPTSNNRIKKNKDALDNLLSLAASLDVPIKLSYSNYSLADLKEQNPSSVLFNLQEVATTKEAAYFDSKIGSSRLVGDAYSQGKELDYSKYEAEALTAEEALEKAWSPSALDIFFQCPRHFYLARILGIPEDEPDDPFVVLSAADIGTLAHSLMEELAASNVSRDEFLQKAGEAFDKALVARPPIHTADAAKEKKIFLKMMETGYDADPHNEVLSAETDYSCEHPSGIKLRGIPDRVEILEDGSHLIADFKTKRRIDHVENDFDTCLQVIVYAWMCEQAGIDISGCEYRYLRKGKSVWCKYDEEMKASLDDFLRYFKQCIETNTFERNENEVSCKYCKMADICGKKQEKLEEE